MKDYLTVGRSVDHEIVLNKSRFIGITYLIDSEDDIDLCLLSARQKYPDATHYCYGCIIGIDGMIQRFSDDGEPGGTAGMPIIQVLLQKGLKNTLVVVVRYFGGIKLGAGGLVRAYTRAAVEAVNKAGIVRMTSSDRGIFEVDYHNLGSVEHFLRRDGILIQDMLYEEKVKITLITNLPWGELVKKLTDLCSGNIGITRLDSVYHNWSDV